MLRFAADFVQRDQAVVNIKRRVFQALGHDGARALLELHHEARVLRDARLVGPVREFERQDILQKIELHQGN